MTSLGAPGPLQDDHRPAVWSKLTALSQQIFLRRFRPARPARALLLAVAFCGLVFLWLMRSPGEVGLSSLLW